MARECLTMNEIGIFAVSDKPRRTQRDVADPEVKNGTIFFKLFSAMLKLFLIRSVMLRRFIRTFRREGPVQRDVEQDRHGQG